MFENFKLTGLDMHNDYPKFIVSNQNFEPISIKMVNETIAVGNETMCIFKLQVKTIFTTL